MVREPATSKQLIVAEQLRSHYAQIPAMVIAPSAGGLFTTWVLWNAVQNFYLVVGMSTVIVLSGFRLVLYKWYFSVEPERAVQFRWKLLAVTAAFLSGCIWGSAAPFLYPPRTEGYEVYLLVLLTLLPIVPVAALASYMPTFYAYYIPCITPFVFSLALQGSRAEAMTALLLVMMMGAMVTFARRYAESLTAAIALRLQLAEKAGELEQLVHHKSRFVRAASHDLRQPLHAMGYSLELLKRPQSKSLAAQWIRELDTSLKSLSGLLDNMLDISKLDADMERAHPRDFSARELLEKLHAEFRPLAEQKSLEFRCITKEMVVHSDSNLLERMLRNLLFNALKFTHRGGVALVCRSHGSEALLQVIDTGSGIPQHQLREIFEEFTQVDSSERTEVKGFGLGLAIVKRLAHLLGHDLYVRSNVAHGSIFSILVSKGSGAAEPLVLEEEAPPVQNGENRLVVVIDDVKSVGIATAELIHQWGYRTIVDTTANGALAKLKAKGENADLLIVDYGLAEGLSGLDAIALFNGYGKGKRVPAIVVTGDTAPERIREVQATGYMMLHKPVKPERLRVCMAAVWSGMGQEAR